MEWKPIESAPRDDDTPIWVIVYKPAKEKTRGNCRWVEEAVIRTAYAMLHGEKWLWWTGDEWDSELLEPTHWMPLPSPPDLTPATGDPV